MRYFIVFISLLITGTFAPSYDDVDDIVNKFSALTTTTTDVFERLNIIKTGSKLFFNAMGTSFGPLFSALTKMSGIAPDSEELQAITKLHTAMNKGFEYTNKQQAKLATHITASMKKLEYFKRATLQLVHIRARLNLSILSTEMSNPQEEIRRFVSDPCASDNNSPVRVLEYISEVIGTHCSTYGMITSETVAATINATAFFKEVDRGLSKSTWWDLDVEKDYELARMSYLHNTMTGMRLESDLQRVKQGVLSVRRTGNNVTRGNLLNLLQSAGVSVADGELCYLSTIYIEEGYRREPVFSFAKIVLNDVELLGFAAGVCEYAKTTDASIAKRELDYIDRLVQKISSTMSRWLDRTLETAWTSVIEYVAKDIIDRNVKKAGELKKGMYDLVAWEIARELTDNVGPNRHMYNVLISDHLYYGVASKKFWSDCTVNGHCAFISNYQDTADVFISRFENDVEETGRAKKANKWFTDNEDKIRTYIRDNFDIDGFVRSDPDICDPIFKKFYDGMVKTFPGLDDSNIFGSRAFLVSVANFESRAWIDVSATNMAVGTDTMNTQRTVSYEQKDAFKYDTHVILHFFI